MKKAERPRKGGQSTLWFHGTVMSEHILVTWGPLSHHMNHQCHLPGRRVGSLSLETREHTRKTDSGHMWPPVY